MIKSVVAHPAQLLYINIYAINGNSDKNKVFDSRITSITCKPVQP